MCIECDDVADVDIDPVDIVITAAPAQIQLSLFLKGEDYIPILSYICNYIMVQIAGDLHSFTCKSYECGPQAT